MNKKLFERLLLFLFIILFIVYSFYSSRRIWAEELIEAVRSPYLFFHRIILEGPNTNIGYYAQLSLIYKIFGFSFYHAKIYKIILTILSTLSLFIIYNKFISKTLIPLPVYIYITSPVVMYYGSNALNHGFDIIVFPIITLLILYRTTLFNKFILTIIGFGAISLASLSYPSCVFIIPVWIIIFINSIKDNYHDRTKFILLLSSAILSYLFVFFTLYFFIENRFDLNNSLFRGAGNIEKINILLFNSSFLSFFNDIFIKGESYHFDVPMTVGSFPFGTIGIFLLTALLFSDTFFKVKLSKKDNIIFGLSILMIILILIIVSVLNDFSKLNGLRRYTGVFIYYFVIYSILIVHHIKTFNTAKINLYNIALIFILINNLFAFFINTKYLSNISSSYQHKSSFYQKYYITKHINNSYQKLVLNNLNKDITYLHSNDFYESDRNFPPFARYELTLYMSIYGSLCMWNRQNCGKIIYIDDELGYKLELTGTEWNKQLMYRYNM